SAFSLEAYLNHVGAVTFKSWASLERLPPWAKLELLCEELEVSFVGGTSARPLQTISQLLSFRNTIAHGRTAELNSKPITRNTENYHSAYHEELLSDWERLIQTSDFAQRVRDDIRAVLERLHEARRDDKEPLFASGSGLHGATLVD